MKNKKLILVLVIIAVIIGVAVFFITNKNDNKESTKDNKNNSSQETEKAPEEPKEEVTLLEFPEATEEERQILERYSNNNDYKVIKINEGNCKGYLIAIYEPERVHVVASSKIGSEGEYVTEMVKNNDALLGINAGGFADPNFDGDGGTPLGITVTNSNMISRDKYINGNAGVVGFDVNNKLVLGKYNADETISNGIRDCVSFGPYLIKDGQTQELNGWGALGPDSRAARTVIGQREDGIVLFLVVDGDRTKNQGATLGEVRNLMKKYGAINACNLDGGTSSQMVVGNSLINDPTSMNGEHRTRPVATAFILSSDKSNNGDNSAIEK
jgi:exopolysaccharide biosynthesis protein